MSRRSLAGIVAALSCTAALALEVVAEAEAPIVNDDLVLARQTALRRAMATAVEQETGLLQSTTIATSSGTETRTTLTPQGRALGARILSEHVARGQLRLTAEVTLAEPGRTPACQNPPKRKLVVSSFPMLYPEQVRYGHYTGWPRTTAEELSRLVNGRGKLLAGALPGQYPFPSAESAPATESRGGIPVQVEWARKERAQYVLAGVIRDFGLATQALVIPERQMAIEAYLYDGISGELVARREFIRQLSFSWSMPKNVAPGSKEFRESRFGERYYELLSDIGQWAENSLSCLPFAARVIRVDGRQLYLDTGSDAGLEPGQELVLSQLAAGSKAANGEALPGERSVVAGVVVRQVFPRHSTAEITAKKNVPTVRVGDVLYGL